MRTFILSAAIALLGVNGFAQSSSIAEQEKNQCVYAGIKESGTTTTFDRDRISKECTIDHESHGSDAKAEHDHEPAEKPQHDHETRERPDHDFGGAK